MSARCQNERPLCDICIQRSFERKNGRGRSPVLANAEAIDSRPSLTFSSKRRLGERRLDFYMRRGKVAIMSIRMRHTKGHTANRRSHHALVGIRAVKDKESGNLRLPHHLDEATGMYRGKQIFSPKVKTKRAKGASSRATVAPHSSANVGDHSHEHANAEAKSTKGIFGKIATGGRPKARSGMGGVAGS